MSSKRLYIILCAVVGLMVVAVLGGTYGANVILQERAKEVTAAKSKVSALDHQQSQLIKAKASIEKYQSVSNIAKSIVPQDKDQAQAVREIVKIADENNIDLSTITFPASTLGGGAGGTATNSNPSQSQLKPATGISGVFTLQITVQSSTTKMTTYNQFIGFLAALESNRRTALVSGITLTPNPRDPSLVSFTLTIDEYIKP